MNFLKVHLIWLILSAVLIIAAAAKTYLSDRDKQKAIDDSFQQQVQKLSQSQPADSPRESLKRRMK